MSFDQDIAQLEAQFARHGGDCAGYLASYRDELETVCSALDRLHPKWRNVVPFSERAQNEVVAIKRYLLRHRQIMTGAGHLGVRIVWREGATQRKPYAASVRPAFSQYGMPVFTTEHRQMINPAMLAKRLGQSFELVEAALDARPVSDRDPRAWVARFAAERQTAEA